MSELIVSKVMVEVALFGGLQTIREREQALLAPYAMHSVDSRGRKHPEPEHPYRGPFQRDRDRIVHSSAFRRLSGKMQVFTGDMGDYHRTRLTHTHEVASIARTIGRSLRLNEDLIEALALFHDLGHPPFGHSGEAALDACLREHGGFSHNRFALTLVEELEERYPTMVGLNLTREVLESQATRITKDATSAAPLWETQVVDLADSITYDAHDTDDALKLGLVTMHEMSEVPLVAECLEAIRQQHGMLAPRMLRKVLVHELIDRQVSDVLTMTASQLAQSVLPGSLEREHGWLKNSPGMLARKQELEQFLYRRVYRHSRLMEVRLLAQERLQRMFERYVSQPELLPEKFRHRAQALGAPRAVGDYLACMTDRFCDLQYLRLFPDVS